jgi:hypothetical protein
MPVILPPFLQYADEASIIGRLMAGYAVLEQDLLNCVAMGVGSFDTALKRLFRIRGGARQIDEGERLGRPVYLRLGLRAEFDEAIASMRHYRVIRNQYAHCRWWADNSGKLAFANLEDAASRATAVPDLLSLQAKHIDVLLLGSQEAFYSYTEGMLRWVNYEGRRLDGEFPSHSVPKPARMSQPPPHIP